MDPLKKMDEIGTAAEEKLMEASLTGQQAESNLAATAAALEHLDEGTAPAAPTTEAAFTAARATLASGVPVPPVTEHTAVTAYRQKWNLPTK